MRLGINLGSQAVCLACALACAAPPASARVADEAPPPAPGPADENLVEALAALEDLDQPPSARDLADLAAQAAGAGPGRGELRLRWRRDGAGAATADVLAAAAGGAWSVRLRGRRGAAADDLAAGTGTLETGPGALTVGGWTWRHGFGLVTGGAGRSGSAAADAGLGPAGGGCRGWSGGPEPQAATGAALVWRGTWTAGAGWGRRDEGDGAAVVVLGRGSEAWQLAVVHGDTAGLAVGAAGRWRRGRWRGAWEVAARPSGSGPALAVQAGWHGRRGGAEVLAVGVPRGPAWAAAAAQPLLGRLPGTAWALRGTWRLRPGTGVAALVAGADRDGGDRPAPERRLVSELVGRAALGGGLDGEVRLRTTARTLWSWDPDWPWAAPMAAPGRRTQVLAVALGRREGAPRWRLRLVTLAVDHAPTAGRRTLATAEVRGGGGPWSWHLAWRLAGGSPVDLADAVSPLPQLVVPRHWGRWRGGWFARLGLATGPCRLDLAADLREDTAGGRSLDLWAGAGAAW